MQQEALRWQCVGAVTQQGRAELCWAGTCVLTTLLNASDRVLQLWVRRVHSTCPGCAPLAQLLLASNVLLSAAFNAATDDQPLKARNSDAGHD